MVKGPAQAVASADGIRIVYEAHGDGATALVFVHGWSCDRSYWDAQKLAFVREFTVVTIDLAGHGDSGLERREWTMAAFGDDVVAVVNALGLKRVVLIGHSMGGDVIVPAALRLPNRVAGLIWVDAYKKLGPGRTKEEVEAFVAPFRADFVTRTQAFVRRIFAPRADPTLVERVAAHMSSAPPKVAIPALESAFGYGRDIPGLLEQLKLPVIAINSDNTPTDVGSLNRYGVEVMVMPGVGHFLHREDPARFNGVLLAAINKLVH